MTTGNSTVVIARSVGHRWVPALSGPIRELGHRCVLVSSALTPGERDFLADRVDEIVEIDGVTDERALAKAATAAADGGTLVGIVTSDDGMVLAAARAAELVGVGRTPARPLELARNKFLARETLRAVGLPTPAYALMRSASEAEAIVAEVGLPAVLKPVNGAGGHLVRVVRSVAELATAYTAAAALASTGALATMYARSVEGVAGERLDPGRVFLVEGFVPGHEYSLDLVIRDGEIEQVALADKAILDDRLFECGFISPPIDLGPEAEARIRTCVDDAVRALGLDNTVAHVELRDEGPGQTCIIEVNAGRPGGQLLAQLFQLNTGIDMTAEALTASCGWPSTRRAPELPIPLASLTVFAHGSGRVAAIEGLDVVADFDEILTVVPQIAVGDHITDEYEIWAINLIAVGFLDVDDLIELYDRAAAAISIDVEPDGSGAHEDLAVGAG